MELRIHLSMLWSLVLLLAFLRLTFTSLRKVEITKAQALFLVFLVALLARLVPNFLLSVGAGYDIESYQIVGDLVLRGEDVYQSEEAHERHPYLPLQMYWMAFARWLSDKTGVLFVQLVRLAPIVADVFIALLIFWMMRGSALHLAFRLGLLYALNPVAIFVSAYHGQFDAIPLFFTLLALCVFTSFPLLGGVSLGIAILSKSWPVLALPALLTNLRSERRKLVFLLSVPIVPLIGLFVYSTVFEAAPLQVLQRALSYNWGVGVWGYGYFFRLLGVLPSAFWTPFEWLVAYGRFLTLAGLGLVWWFRARHEEAAAGTLTILVAFFALTHAFSIQYLVWLVPFALVVQDTVWLRYYTMAAYAYMFLAYGTLILMMTITELLPWPQADYALIMPAGLPAWLVTVAWLVDRLKRPLKDKEWSRANQPSVALVATSKVDA